MQFLERKNPKDLANDCTGMPLKYVVLRSLKNRKIHSSTSKCTYFFHMWKAYSAHMENPNLFLNCYYIMMKLIFVGGSNKINIFDILSFVFSALENK